MELSTAPALNALGDPKALGALRQRAKDPAAAKALAGQFAGMLLQRVMQNGNGEAIGMAGGVGSNIVNTMFATTVAQTVAADDKLGLADILFRSIEAKQQAANQVAGGVSATPRSGNGAAADATAAMPAPTASPASDTPGVQGFALSPYWQGNGRRPLVGPATGSVPRGTAMTAALVAAGGNSGMAVPQRGRVAAPLAPLGPSISPTVLADRSSRSGAAISADIEVFSRQLAPLLQRAGAQLGVSPKTLLAQAALETGWGRSVVGNNVFGIKAGSSWVGDRVTANTHEVENGQWVPQRAAFRAYPSLDAAVQDYVALISGSSRYRAALGLGDDARGYGQALIAGGYATDTTYPDKLGTVAAGPSVAAAFPAVMSASAVRQ